MLFFVAFIISDIYRLAELRIAFFEFCSYQIFNAEIDSLLVKTLRSSLMSRDVIQVHTFERIVYEFLRINYILFPLKLSENHRFSDDFRGNGS